jgi:predicted nucleic acid-binding protein
MGKVIDSSVLIAAERGKLDLSALLDGASAAKEDVVAASITASELLHGVHRATRTADRARREAFVENILATVPIIPFDLIVARVHARLWADLSMKGQNVGPSDLIIAATALSLGYDVATRNEREFAKVPGLNVVKW